MDSFFKAFNESPPSNYNISKQHEKCLELKQRMIKNNPVIRFMLENLKRVGCPMDVDDHFKCMPCDDKRSGGFSIQEGIIICENQIVSKQHLQDTMTHELIHAFDHCTTKIDWNNCKHYACTEIRAAALSGECKFTREIQRGNFNIGKQFQNCIKRRAQLALDLIPHCQGEVGRDAIHQVWDACYNDTTPFDEIY